MAEVFQLKNPDSIEIQIKSRKNLAKESSGRVTRLTMARVAIYLYEKKDVYKRDIKRAKNEAQRLIAQSAYDEVDNLENWLDFNFKSFRIATDKNLKNIKEVIETCGKRTINK